jgi:uncharacterized protein (TIGR02271 family)
MTKANKTSSPKEGTVVGLFQERQQAELAIQQLQDAGFTNDQIGVLMQDREGQKDLADSTGTKVSESAASGAIGGGVAGGIVGLLAGIGALAIPGVGPIIAGGALASTLAGAGIGAAAGGLLGALVGMGIPEEDARYFEEGLRAGGVLVTVQADNRADEARRILRDRGADLEAAGSVSSARTGEGQQPGEGRQRLELREEELRANKEQVQAGEVRLRKEVVEEKKTIEVPVSREEVVVERRPVTGRTPSDSDITEGEEIRIPVMEEEVRVEKTPVVKEEVTASKRRVEETKKVSDTVRREEARMEETGDAHVSSGSGSKSEGWRGNERRYRDDSSYTGPERRLANV